jgi:mono/diheme cytochrome c family protein
MVIGQAVTVGLLAWAQHSSWAGAIEGRLLDIFRSGPERRGRALFASHCASCHVLGDLGNQRTTVGSKLDGWGTVRWIEAMVHDPDAPEFFGRGPYKGQMPSADTRPRTTGFGWVAMLRSRAERHAVAVFLASQGDEPDDAHGPNDEAARALGETIVHERCTTCHLYKGGGDDDGSELAPELSGYGSIEWTVALIRNPMTSRTYRGKAVDSGVEKHMPQFDRVLEPADIDFLARWTRARARGLSLR